jgi:hypothetical protein
MRPAKVKVRPVAAEVLTKERRELSFMEGGVLVCSHYA